MAHIRKRIKEDGTTVYNAIIRKKDHPITMANFDNELDAKAWIEQHERAINIARAYEKTDKILNKNKKGHLFIDVLDKYIEHHLIKKKDGAKRIAQLGYWREQFSKEFIQDITTEKIEKCIEQLSKKISIKNKKPLSSATLQRYTACLSHLFTIALKEWKLIDTHPVHSINYSSSNKNTRIGSYHHVSRQDQWIKLSERYPEINTGVLALDALTGFSEVAFYNPKNPGSHWESNLAGVIQFYPTHWMPFPELPTDF